MNNPLDLIILLFALSLLPLIIILTTCFIKISVVCLLARESLGVQQIPPNIVIYGLSLILSCYVMGPIYNRSYISISNDVTTGNNISATSILNDIKQSSSSIEGFLYKHSEANERDFFYKSLQEFWTPDMLKGITRNSFIVLVPAFMISELTQAFKIGFLIYLPAVIIDIVISNILMAMGMMMMSPVTISLPIKILLFIAVDGWSRLIHVILASYS